MCPSLVSNGGRRSAEQRSRTRPRPYIRPGAGRLLPRLHQAEGRGTEPGRMGQEPARREGGSRLRRPLRKGQRDTPLVRGRSPARLRRERRYGYRGPERRTWRLRGPLNGTGTDFPAGLRRLLDEESVEITSSRPIDHGTQYDLAREGETAKLNVYHTGKVSTGGRASGLRDLLDGWRTSQTKTTGEGAPARPSGARPALDGTPRLGIHEAGKGDYFGPLVVAGVRIIGSEQAKELQKMGVRDSKEISVLDVRRISEIILETVGPENVRVASLSPGEYEARRVVAGNVNRLLGE